MKFNAVSTESEQDIDGALNSIFSLMDDVNGQGICYSSQKAKYLLNSAQVQTAAHKGRPQALTMWSRLSLPPPLSYSDYVSYLGEVVFGLSQRRCEDHDGYRV